MRFLAMSAGAGLLLSVASPALADAQGDDVWATAVQLMLDETVRFFNDRGYHYSGYSHRGWLSDNQDEASTFTLRGGTDTVFSAGCDTDCSDIDIVVYDPGGRELIADRDPDDNPTVYFTPAKSGDYSVSVTMATCTKAPCFYLLGEYQK